MGLLLGLVFLLAVLLLLLALVGDHLIETPQTVRLLLCGGGNVFKLVGRLAEVGIALYGVASFLHLIHQIFHAGIEIFDLRHRFLRGLPFPRLCPDGRG